ncbi:unnamed protein product [Anisakis simplex]|uniref:POPLD domain-containing protein n=1 Tax=Anisakis simplex TaxID=6269 RepID=A0A0M3JWT8_ANISI|nr:unnamed protein product [Anisakis simplex]
MNDASEKLTTHNEEGPSSSMLRLELETKPDLCMHLFVPDPEKREIEFCLRGEIAASLLQSFSFGEIPSFLIDILENSKVCLFHQGCIPLWWQNRIQWLHPSMRTLFCDEQLISESVDNEEARIKAVNEYWRSVGPPPAKRRAFWSPHEEVTRHECCRYFSPHQSFAIRFLPVQISFLLAKMSSNSIMLIVCFYLARTFLMRNGWRTLRQKEQSNESDLVRLRAMSEATTRLRERFNLKRICRRSRLHYQNIRIQNTARAHSSSSADCSEPSATTAQCKYETATEIAERRWKEENEKTNDKLYDGLLFKNVPDGQGVSNWELNISRDRGKTCWARMSVSNPIVGHIQGVPFPVGTEMQLSTFLTHLGRVRGGREMRAAHSGSAPRKSSTGVCVLCAEDAIGVSILATRLDPRRLE